MKRETWVIVANSTLARIFKLNNLQLEEMNTLVHPESRLHERDLVSDKPGATYAGVASGRYGMTQQHSPKKTEAVTFAKELADHLESARTSGQIDRLFVAANPSFLGMLRQEMGQPTANLIASEVAKDITAHKPDEIRGYFPIGL